MEFQVQVLVFLNELHFNTASGGADILPAAGGKDDGDNSADSDAGGAGNVAGAANPAAARPRS